MAPSGAKRRLTTILAADVQGYTRLMRADEEATLATLTTYREIIDGLNARHDGRIFSTGGDSVLEIRGGVRLELAMSGKQPRRGAEEHRIPRRQHRSWPTKTARHDELHASHVIFRGAHILR